MTEGGFEANSISRVVDAIRGAETAYGWVYDPVERDFYIPPASHALDGGDAFGRATSDRVPLQARAMINVSFLFRRISAGASAGDIPALTAGVSGTAFCASIPEGVDASWSATQNRSFTEGVVSPEGPSGNVVNTRRQTVPAGVSLQAIASRLPGYKMRIDGDLSISSFVGSTLDTSSVSVPLEFDGPRGAWHRILRIQGADIGLTGAFKGVGFKGSATGDVLEVFIRVD